MNFKIAGPPPGGVVSDVCANKGLTAIWCVSAANKGLTGFFARVALVLRTRGIPQTNGE